MATTVKVNMNIVMPNNGPTFRAGQRYSKSKTV